MRRWLILFACLPACDYVLGLHAFDHAPDGGTDPNLDLGIVTGTFRQHGIQNTTMAYPIAIDRAPLEGQITASVMLPDGSVRMVKSVGADGGFEFTTQTVGQAYALEIVTQFNDTVYELDATTIELVERFSGRLDRQLVPDGTAITLKAPGHPASGAGTKEELQTTGIWSTRLQLANEGATGFPVDWTAVRGIGGPMGLLVGPAFDAIYYTHYLNETSPQPYVRLDTIGLAAAVTTVGGAVTPVTVTLTTVNKLSCTRLVAAMAAESARVQALHPTGALARYWAINAHPLAEFASTSRYPIAYSFGAPSVDLDVSPAYGQPYAGHSLDAELTIIIGFNNTATMVTTVIPVTSNGCVGPTTIPVGMIAVPIELTLNNLSLFENDGGVFTLPAKGPVHVTWNVSDTGTASYFVVKLQEILDLGADPVNPRLRDEVTVVTLGHAATIDRSHFTSGLRYRVQVSALGGYTNAAAGDFATVLDTTSTAVATGVQFTAQ